MHGYPSTHSRFCISIVFLTVSSGFPLAAQTQVSIVSGRDNTLYESTTGSLSNGAGQHMFAGRSNQPANSIRRALIAFDIAAHVPSGATVLGVSLTLNMSQQPGFAGGPEPINVHRMLADWGEGASVAPGNEGGGASATAGDATWLHRSFNASFWTVPGGDFAATPSGGQNVAGIGFYTWVSTPEMVADVQLWLDNPSSNFGWMIVGNEGDSQTAKRFDTRENINPDVRPQLNVSFLPPVSVEEQLETPDAFALLQNYPNPFNPGTSIRFTVDGSGFTSLKVFDLLGREVATLVNEERPAGSYSVEWIADGLASGVYFYKLSTGKFSDMKRLVLLR